MTQQQIQIPQKIKDDSDADDWLAKAFRHEKRHEWLAAIAIYDELAKQLAGTSNGAYAINCAEKLRGYIAAGGLPADAPYTGPTAAELGFHELDASTIRIIQLASIVSVIVIITASLLLTSGLAISGLFTSVVVFTGVLFFGSGLGFHGVRVGLVPMVDVISPFGRYGVLLCFPVYGLHAYIKVVHGKWAITIPYYCCWVFLISTIATVIIFFIRDP